MFDDIDNERLLLSNFNRRFITYRIRLSVGIIFFTTNKKSTFLNYRDHFVNGVHPERGENALLCAFFNYTHIPAT